VDIDLLREALLLLRACWPNASSGDFSIGMDLDTVQVYIEFPHGRGGDAPYYGDATYECTGISTNDALRKLIDEQLRPQLARIRAGKRPELEWPEVDD
jgi:hypothetical protein